MDKKMIPILFLSFFLVACGSNTKESTDDSSTESSLEQDDATNVEDDETSTTEEVDTTVEETETSSETLSGFELQKLLEEELKISDISDPFTSFLELQNDYIAGNTDKESIEKATILLEIYNDEVTVQFINLLKDNSDIISKEQYPVLISLTEYFDSISNYIDFIKDEDYEINSANFEEYKDYSDIAAKAYSDFSDAYTDLD